MVVKHRSGEVYERKEAYGNLSTTFTLLTWEANLLQ